MLKGKILFWQCSHAGSYQSVWGTFCLQLQDRQLLLLLWSGCNRFPKNVDNHPQDYRVSPPMRTKFKTKFVLVLKHHSMRNCGCGGIEPLSRKVDISWKWVTSFTPRPHYPPQKEPCVPSEQDTRLGFYHSWPGCIGDRMKNTRVCGSFTVVQPLAGCFSDWAVLSLSSVVSIRATCFLQSANLQFVFMGFVWCSQ